MSSATAAAAVSTRIVTPTYRDAPARDGRVIERYIRWFATAAPQLSDRRASQFAFNRAPIDILGSTVDAGALRFARYFSPGTGTFINGPNPIRPKWLADTQRCIRNSVLLNTNEVKNDGRWLNQTIADAANDFFQKTADLLPGQPFVYSSKRGDLIAEFKAEHGTFTSIVSESFVLLFAVIDGVPMERKILGPSDAREEVRSLTTLLQTGLNGVEAPK